MLKKLLLAATMLSFLVPAMQAQVKTDKHGNTWEKPDPWEKPDSWEKPDPWEEPDISRASLNRTWFSVHFGHNAYDGDLGNEMMEYDIGSDWSGGIGFHQYLSPSFDFDAILEYGYLDYKNDNSQEAKDNNKANLSFGTKYVNANLMLRYKLANGYIFSEDATIQPFVGAGVGVTPYFDGRDNIYFGKADQANDIDSRVGFSVPLAAGFDIKLSEKTKLFLKYTYNRTFVDGFDGYAEGGLNPDIDGKDHDDFAVTSVGFKFNVGGSKDTDGDGIPDKLDRCPETPGPKEFDGCPDTDGDGIPDIDDRCPEVAGPAEFDGCPDTDGDGIPDVDDRCPEVAGPAEFDGCPDTDGDGIPDIDDRCPEEAGPAEFYGCPDRDGDGIPDIDDECPDQPGPKENNGCPYDYEYDNVLFGFDKSNVEEGFESELDEVAETLMDDTGLKVTLEGHTDAVGPEQYNLRLSERRAESVKSYLVGQGVSADRVFTKGYGKSQLKVDTQSKERENRRVVINIERM